MSIWHNALKIEKKNISLSQQTPTVYRYIKCQSKFVIFDWTVLKENDITIPPTIRKCEFHCLTYILTIWISMFLKLLIFTMEFNVQWYLKISVQ